MRMFVACEIPSKLKDELEDFQNSLKNEKDRIKWVEKQNLHLTMKFIGETEEKDLERIKQSLSSVKFKSFLTSVSDFGVFPHRGHIRVVWMGLSPADQINNLHEKIDSSLNLEKDNRFQAHITLGRVKFIQDKEHFVKKVNEIKGKFKSEPFKIDRFVLKKSVLTPEGPIYSDLTEFRLE